jgi:hypothetical protein
MLLGPLKNIFIGLETDLAPSIVSLRLERELQIPDAGFAAARARSPGAISF